MLLSDITTSRLGSGLIRQAIAGFVLTLMLAAPSTAQMLKFEGLDGSSSRGSVRKAFPRAVRHRQCPLPGGGDIIFPADIRSCEELRVSRYRYLGADYSLKFSFYSGSGLLSAVTLQRKIGHHGSGKPKSSISDKATKKLLKDAFMALAEIMEARYGHAIGSDPNAPPLAQRYAALGWQLGGGSEGQENTDQVSLVRAPNSISLSYSFKKANYRPRLM